MLSAVGCSDDTVAGSEFKPEKPRPVKLQVVSVGIVQDKTEFKTQIEQDIKKAILSRTIIRPSVQGVREVFSGVGNDRISALLKELGEMGERVPRGSRGWKYAS